MHLPRLRQHQAPTTSHEVLVRVAPDLVRRHGLAMQLPPLAGPRRRMDHAPRTRTHLRLDKPDRHRGPNATTTTTQGGLTVVSAAGRLLLRRRLQGGDERLLRHLDAAHHLHPPLALFLLLEQLALAGDVTAVALREHVLADRADVLAGDHPRPDCGLDRYLELLPRDELAQLRRH